MNYELLIITVCCYTVVIRFYVASIVHRLCWEVGSSCFPQKLTLPGVWEAPASHRNSRFTHLGKQELPVSQGTPASHRNSRFTHLGKQELPVSQGDPASYKSGRAYSISSKPIRFSISSEARTDCRNQRNSIGLYSSSVICQSRLEARRRSLSV